MPVASSSVLFFLKLENMKLYFSHLTPY